mgnify:CR=1 FL=1
MAYPTVLSDLINYFRKLPGIGEKSAERMALSLLELSSEDVAYEEVLDILEKYLE